MAKGLFRNIKWLPKNKKHQPNIKVQAQSHPNTQYLDKIKKCRAEDVHLTTSVIKSLPKFIPIRNLDTGEISQAEVMGIGNVLENNSEISNGDLSDSDAEKLSVKNEAYIRAVKGLILMNLDADIFMDSMIDLREKYYGKSEPPNEGIVNQEKCIQKNHKNFNL
jgi:hypothetical protein